MMANINQDRNIQIEGNVDGSIVISGDGNVVIFKNIHTRIKEVSKPLSIGPNPYKGLEAFESKDADYFFGREKLINIIWQKYRRLHETYPDHKNAFRLLTIMGPSGSGKSSVAKAGFVPELARRPLPGIPEVQFADFTPGSHPIQALAATLSNVATNDPAPVAKTREFTSEMNQLNERGEWDGLLRIIETLPKVKYSPLVLLVDQFEEIYSLCNDKNEQRLFVENLLYAAGDANGSLSVVITLRSDFLGQTQCQQNLNNAIASYGIIVPAMNREELRLAIAQPAKVAGHPLDLATVELLVSEADGHDGALPLLEFALTRIWQGMGIGLEPVDTLKKIGGVGGAMAGEAERLYNSLSDKDKLIVRRIFCKLVHLGERTSDTRRRVSLSYLVAYKEDPDHVREILRIFSKTEGRLITLSSNSKGEEIAEVTHEALFEYWDTLKGWLESGREDLRFERRLTEASINWNKQQRPDGSLWRSPDLDRLKSFHMRAASDMTEIQTAFFNASVSKEKWIKRFKLILIFVLSALIVSASGAAYYAQYSANEAYSLLLKNYWSNAISAKKNGNFLKASHLFARAGEKGRNISQINNSILNIQNYRYFPLLLSQFEHGGLRGERLNKDATRILTWGENGLAGLRVTMDETLAVKPMKHNQSIKGAIFNKDESLILTWTWFNFKNRGVARLWHARDGSLAAKPMIHERWVQGAVFNKDESMILTWSGTPYKYEGAARLWHSVDGTPATARMMHDDRVEGAGFNKDESLVLTWGCDSSVRLWHAKNGVPAVQPMRHDVIRNVGPYNRNVDVRIHGASFNNDESLILSWGGDNTARIWNAEDGSPAVPPMKHKGWVEGALFNQDESLVLTWSRDGTARLWQTNNGKPATQSMKHDDNILEAIFNKDESLILTRSSDKSVRLWHSKDGSPAAPPITHNDFIEGAVFSKDGSLILTYSYDGTARLWHANSGLPKTPPLRHSKGINGAVFIKDESLILTWGDDGIARLWNVSDGSPASFPMKHKGPIYDVRFKSDKNLFLTSGLNIVRLWKMNEKPPITLTLKHPDSVNGALLNKDESQILTWTTGGKARLWNVKDGSPATPLIKHKQSIWGAKFSNDELYILTRSLDGTVRLWHTKDSSPAAQPINHADDIVGAEFSRNDSLILTWSRDKTARLWHVNDGSAATPPMKHESQVNGAMFNKNGSMVLTWSGKSHEIEFSRDAVIESKKSPGAVQLWNVKDGSPALPPIRHDQGVNGAMFSKDERSILTWCADGTVRLWGVREGNSITTPMKHNDEVRGAVFNRNESLILTWSYDKTVRLWNVKDGSLALPPIRHDHEVNGAIFNRDETLILSWSVDGTARLWHTKDGTPAAESMKHRDAVKGAVFNEDERLILTWSDDGTVNLWHVEDGSQVGYMKHDKEVWGAIFTKDESRILSWSADGTVRLWNNNIADYDFPKKHLKLLVEVSTGTVMDDMGNINMLSTEEWIERKKKYIRICEKHLDTCRYKEANLYLKQKQFWESGP